MQSPSIPSEWLPEIYGDPSSPFYNDRRDAFKPFSDGPRNCIGRNLAYHEMRLILAKVLWGFDLELAEGSGRGDDGVGREAEDICALGEDAVDGEGFGERGRHE